VVVKKLYVNPLLDIFNRVEYYYTPFKHPRSKLLAVSGLITLPEIENLNNIKKWTIFEIDPVYGNDVKQIDISDIASVDYSELVLKPYRLEYGLYRFNLRVRYKHYFHHRPPSSRIRNNF
jgi:hypothetical protein